jgi:hypothetical protein
LIRSPPKQKKTFEKVTTGKGQLGNVTVGTRIVWESDEWVKDMLGKGLWENVIRVKV